MLLEWQQTATTKCSAQHTVIFRDHFIKGVPQSKLLPALIARLFPSAVDRKNT